jgi:hypothetical protein
MRIGIRRWTRERFAVNSTLRAAANNPPTDPPERDPPELRVYVLEERTPGTMPVDAFRAERGRQPPASSLGSVLTNRHARIPAGP